MKNAIISAMIFGIIQINVHATMSSTQATDLHMVNEDLVLERTLSVEWTKDANLAKTMCDSNHPLWQSFEPTAVEQATGRSRETICSHNGMMNWHEAIAWISHLNAHRFLGHSDWRLPRVEQHDSTCSLQVSLSSSAKSFGLGQGCLNSEIGHLLHDTLGNPVNQYSSCTDNCLSNPGPFHNISRDMYWSGTEITQDTSLAGVFAVAGDWQDAEEKTSDLLHVWPVRDL